MRKAKLLTTERFIQRYYETDVDTILSEITRDFKVKFDLENYEIPLAGGSNNILGLKKLYTKGGYLPFIIGSGGGDWEFDVKFAVYIDIKGKWRAYIPKQGNAYNWDTKKAFGEDNTDVDFLYKWLKENTELTVSKEDIDSSMDQYADMMIDLEKMILDITKRIEVVR